MGRIFGLLMIVAGMYLGAEIYTKGIDHAFGGVLAGLNDPLQSQTGGHPADQRTLGQRVGDHVQADIDGAFGRRMAEE